MKHTFFCYACENEYTISHKGKGEAEYCPFCSNPLEDADKDEDEEFDPHRDLD